MAKFKWWKHRFSSDGIKIFHFARRGGKTTRIFDEALKGDAPNCFILSSADPVARHTATQFCGYLRERNIDFSTDRRGDLVRVNGRRFIFHTANRMARGMRDGVSLAAPRSEFYIDNMDNIVSDDIHALQCFIYNLIGEGVLKGVSITNEQFNNSFLYEIFFEKILARNKKLYYHRQHEERTINRYINFGTYSSRADADAELRPRSLLAS
jgi:hypothetical protein